MKWTIQNFSQKVAESQLIRSGEHKPPAAMWRHVTLGRYKHEAFFPRKIMIQCDLDENHQSFGKYRIQ